MSHPTIRSGLLAMVATIVLLPGAKASVIVYAQDLAGFNIAAGNPPVSIDFDSIVPGTDITGSTIAGVTFTGPGAPLIVVRGADTVTPAGVFAGAPNVALNQLLPTSGENVLSPGGAILGPGPDPAVESDDLTLDFASPLSAFGFDHLSQSADGFSFTSIAVFDSANNQLYGGGVPISDVGGQGGGAPGAADFWGVVSTASDISRIVITESDNNAQFPDCNIGFDTFRFGSNGGGQVPEPGTVSLILTGLAAMAGTRLRRK